MDAGDLRAAQTGEAAEHQRQPGPIVRVVQGDHSAHRRGSASAAHAAAGSGWRGLRVRSPAGPADRGSGAYGPRCQPDCPSTSAQGRVDEPADGYVVAVEPSAAMRANLRLRSNHAVTSLAGVARLRQRGGQVDELLAVVARGRHSLKGTLRGVGMSRIGSRLRSYGESPSRRRNRCAR